MPAWICAPIIERFHGFAMASGTADRINALAKRIPTGPLYAIALLPAAWVFLLALQNRLGADPMRALEQELGLWGLRFMIATLAVTPLREWTGISLLRFRRVLGLTVFFHACLHLCVYVALDRQFAWAAIAGDLWKRPYILFGMTAFVLLAPLAATSTDNMIRRLGAAAWRSLHKLAYPAALLIVLHQLWLVKTWTAEPLAYAAIVVILLAARWRSLAPRRPARA
jgi:sulfoxide reductase heme-binding subunit YedZ